MAMVERKKPDETQAFQEWKHRAGPLIFNLLQQSAALLNRDGKAAGVVKKATGEYVLTVESPSGPRHLCARVETNSFGVQILESVDGQPAHRSAQTSLRNFSAEWVENQIAQFIASRDDQMPDTHITPRSHK
ncbi:MAG TPA: hypothetical protein VK696_06990 [Steroidobacteraceae bacterium]|jgi:hypothetical protein|nr:hypothetical protein [Steroidobacteraceae bacterium]